MDSPERFNSSGDIDVAAGENNFRIRLSYQPIHLGAGGLDLPLAGDSLPSDSGSNPIIADIANATDDEILAMQELLKSSRAQLQGRIVSLQADILAVERQEEQGVTMASNLLEASSDIEMADLEAEAALSQSIALRSSIALSGISGMDETRSLALQLLR